MKPSSSVGSMVKLSIFLADDLAASQQLHYLLLGLRCTREWFAGCGSPDCRHLFFFPNCQMIGILMYLMFFSSPKHCCFTASKTLFVFFAVRMTGPKQCPNDLTARGPDGLPCRPHVARLFARINSRSPAPLSARSPKLRHLRGSMQHLSWLFYTRSHLWG